MYVYVEQRVNIAKEAISIRIVFMAILDKLDKYVIYDEHIA